MGALLIKDLKILISDKKSLAILILMPLINSIILGFALGGVFDQGMPFKTLSVAVVKDYDGQSLDLATYLEESFFSEVIGQEAMTEMTESAESIDIEKIFFKDFLDSDDLREIVTYEIMSEEEAYALMKADEIDGIIRLPENFLYGTQINFMTIFNSPVVIETIVHPDASLKSRILTGLAESFTNQLTTMHGVKNIMMASAISNNRLEDLEHMDALFDIEMPEKTYSERNLVGKKIVSAKAYYSAAMLSMFLLFSASYGSKLLLRERKNFTYQRQTIAGTSFLKVIISKTLTVFVLVIFQSTVLIQTSKRVFDIDWGDSFAIMSIVVMTGFCVAAMGQLLGAIAMKQDDFKIANVLESGLFQLFAFIGGSFLPLSSLPAVFQPLSYLLVNGVALRAYLKALEGGSIGDIQGLLALLGVYGFIFIGLSSRVLKKGGRDIYA